MTDDSNDQEVKWCPNTGRRLTDGMEEYPKMSEEDEHEFWHEEFGWRY